MLRSIVLLLGCPALLAAQSVPLASSDAKLPVAHAVRTHDAIRLDGRLDEPAWATAPVTSTFTQIDPDEGQPASERTEVRVLYDDQALYVGARLYDRGPIVGRLGRRDMDLGDSDWFGVMLDSYHDHRTAFGFDVNPAGVRRDEVKTIDIDDNSWDAVWDVATTVDSAGWTVELRIPFSQLRFSRDSVQTWGVQFERVIGRRREYSVSTFIPKRESGGVPRYGLLDGLRDLQPGNRLELLPYTVTRAEYVNPGLDPYRTDAEYHATGGLDARYRVASNLTLNATINPDFGQVEVDPAVVNLGVYETFFQEKRPFFLEGSEIFDFGAGGTSGGQLFYSRRIGRQPTLSPPTASADVPPTTTILGAGKLSGKVAGWSIGTLAALTGREDARYRDTAGADRLFPSEPAAGYLVSRVRREFRGGRSFIGGVLTAVHRSLDDSVLQESFRGDAFAGGVDFRHEWANRSWDVHGDVEGSHIAGTPAAIVAVERASNHFFQRPDAPQLHYDTATSKLDGYSMNAALEKQGGEHWLGSIAGALTSPGYEVNDLGYSYRTDRRDAQGVVTYVENVPGALLRRWQASGTLRSERNYANQPIQTFAALVASATTPSYWSMQLFARREFQAYDDRLTRGGPLALRPAEVDGQLALQSDARLPVLGTLTLTGARGDYGGWNASAGLSLGVKTSTRWNLSAGPTLTRAFIPAQYVWTVPDASYAPTSGARYVFAPLAYTQLGLEGRLNVTFTPLLSLETYVQPLLSTGSYGAAKQLVAPRTYDFVEYSGTVPNLDFNLRSLRGNAVLRWEWRSGSTLYVAWQQRRSDVAPIGDFSFGRDRRALDADPEPV